MTHYENGGDVKLRIVAGTVTDKYLAAVMDSL